jgi:hypothetical protein
VTFTGAHWPGVYRLWTGKNPAADPDAVRFAVRTPPGESDLTPLGAARAEQISGWLNAAWADPDRRPLPLAQESARAGWDLWIAGLGLVLALGVVELFVTGRWAGRDA